MSLQTTLARGEVRHWEQEWKRHWPGCPACAKSSGKTPSTELCRHGQGIASTLAIARGNLKHEREADKAPIPDQLMLDECAGEG